MSTWFPVTSVIYYYRFELLFLLYQITLTLSRKAYIPVHCLRVVNFTQTYWIYSLFGQFYAYAGAGRVESGGGGGCAHADDHAWEMSFIYFTGSVFVLPRSRVT